MKGILDLVNDKWMVRYRFENEHGIITYKSIPIASYDTIMMKKDFIVDAEVDFELHSEKVSVSTCTCTNEDGKMHSCPYFVGHGINDCLKYEESTRMAAKILKIYKVASKLTFSEIMEGWGEWASASGYLTVKEFANHLDRDYVPQEKNGKQSELIYLASPYSHPDYEVMVENYKTVSRIAADMVSEGHVVMAPITYGHHLIDFKPMPADWGFWYNFCVTFLSKCDKLIVCKMEGWDRSKGVLEEIELAHKFKIPVEYLEV